MTLALRSLEKHQLSDELLWSVSWCPNRNEVVCCGSDKKKESIMNYETEFIRTIRSTAFSPCGDVLAACSFDSTTNVYFLDPTEGLKFISNIEGHDSEVKSVCWDYGGNFLATCGRDCSVWVWEFVPPNEFHCATVTNHHTQDVKKLLVSCGYDSQILFYDLDEEEEWVMTDSYKIGHKTSWSLCFRPDGKYLAACTEDSKIYIFDVSCLRRYHHLVNPDSTLTFNAFICEHKTSQIMDLMDISWYDYTLIRSGDGQYIATCSRDNSIHIHKVVFDEKFYISLELVIDIGSEVNSLSWRTSTDYDLVCVDDNGCLSVCRFIKE